MTLKTTELWSCCMPVSASVIEPGRSLWTLGQEPTLPTLFTVKSFPPAMYVDCSSYYNMVIFRTNTMFFYSSLAIFRPLHHRKIRRHRLGAAHSQHNLYGRVHLLRPDHLAPPTPLRRQPPCGYTQASHGRHLRHCPKTIRFRSATSPTPALAPFDGRD